MLLKKFDKLKVAFLLCTLGTFLLIAVFKKVLKISKFISCGSKLLIKIAPY